MIITSKTNSIIKEISKLNFDRKFREQSGLFTVEGIKTVNECILANCKIRNIICTEANANKYADAIVVSDNVFKSISGEKTPQGVLAVVEKERQFIMPPEHSCILLDRIQDPGNLGTIIRTANAAGYNEIYLINCTDAFSPKAVRASMSGIFFVKIYCGSTNDILNALKNIPLICADMEGENIFSFKAPQKFCLCIGNEGRGISEELFSNAQYKVKIPMRETCESLNAAVSAGIAMYQLINNKR